MYVYTQTYMHRITISDKRDHKFEKVQVRLEFRGRKQKGEMLYLYYNIKFKIKQNKKKPQKKKKEESDESKILERLWLLLERKASTMFGI